MQKMVGDFSSQKIYRLSADEIRDWALQEMSQSHPTSNFPELWTLIWDVCVVSSTIQHTLFQISLCLPQILILIHSCVSGSNFARRRKFNFASFFLLAVYWNKSNLCLFVSLSLVRVNKTYFNTGQKAQIDNSQTLGSKCSNIMIK